MPGTALSTLAMMVAGGYQCIQATLHQTYIVHVHTQQKTKVCSVLQELILWPFHPCLLFYSQNYLLKIYY